MTASLHELGAAALPPEPAAPAGHLAAGTAPATLEEVLLQMDRLRRATVAMRRDIDLMRAALNIARVDASASYGLLKLLVDRTQGGGGDAR